MLELLINIETLLVIAVIAFATYANCAKEKRNAIFGFLIACILLGSLIFLIYESVISIVIAILYISLASLFITIPEENTMETANRRAISLGAIATGIVFSFATNAPNTIISNIESNAIFAPEALTLMFFLFIFIITEIIHLHSKRP